MPAAVTPMPMPTDAATVTALMVFDEMPILPLASASSRYDAPSGATSSQLWPATTLDRRSRSSCCQSVDA